MIGEIAFRHEKGTHRQADGLRRQSWYDFEGEVGAGAYGTDESEVLARKSAPVGV